MKNLELQKKYFVIINSNYIGDILLTSCLIQNIKQLYKDSYIIMITTSENTVDVAQNIKFVDETFVWLRKSKHKGLAGMLKFVKDFPYKDIFAAIPIYSNDRLVLLSRLLRPKYVLSSAEKTMARFLMKSKYFIKNKPELSVQEMDLNVLSGLTKETLLNCPIKYVIPEITTQNTQTLEKQDFIVLCPITSKTNKDIKFETVADIIRKCDKNVVLLGAGETAKQLSQNLKELNFSNLIDLTNKTSIPEASKIIQMSKGVISADTGLLHLTCAVGKDVVEVVYDIKLYKYIPDTKLYKISILYNEYNANVILKTLEGLTTDNMEKTNAR